MWKIVGVYVLFLFVSAVARESQQFIFYWRPVKNRAFVFAQKIVIIVKSAQVQTTTELKQIFTNEINKIYICCNLIAETSKTKLGHPKLKLILILIGKKLTLRYSSLKKRSRCL